MASGTGSGRSQPHVAQRDQVAEPVGRAVVERPGQRPLRAGPLPADGVRGPALVGEAGGEREQVEPGRSRWRGLSRE